ncbi:MAG TPA: hypothetical protein ACHBX0_12735 [Arsenophonus sp.]
MKHGSRLSMLAGLVYAIFLLTLNTERWGGNPVQKIAILKLLQAIAQAAATPDDEAQ